MEIVLIVGLFCALIFLTHVSDKNTEKPALPVPSPAPPILPPSPKRFVSVVFNEGDNKTYDYFFDNNLNLMVNDYVEVSARGELKIAIVKYVSAPGERSAYAWATVIRRVPAPPPKVYIPPPPQSTVYTPQPPRTVSTPKPIYNPQPKQSISPPPLPSSKRFVQVIFKKRSKKRYDYLLGDIPNVNIGDFVVVHVNINGKTTWKIAKVMYISSSGEVSPNAKSPIIKKADYPKW